MAIHTVLKFNNTDYTNEPIHIFIHSLNSIYLLLTQILHPTLHNNHQDKTILAEMATMLQQRTQSTTISKVRAHFKIKGNEIANTLAKEGRFKQHYYPTLPHEHAYATPYYLQKNFWKGNLIRTPYKGPIKHFQRYLIKYDYEYHLLSKAEVFPSINKLTHNENIHNKLSNNFWNNPHISEAQIKQLLKFQTGQYMGNARKHLFWPNCFLNPYCTLYPTQSIDTWTHVLLNCTQHHYMP